MSFQRLLVVVRRSRYCQYVTFGGCIYLASSQPTLKGCFYCRPLSRFISSTCRELKLLIESRNERKAFLSTLSSLPFLTGRICNKSIVRYRVRDRCVRWRIISRPPFIIYRRIIYRPRIHVNKAPYRSRERLAALSWISIFIPCSDFWNIARLKLY